MILMRLIANILSREFPDIQAMFNQSGLFLFLIFAIFPFEVLAEIKLKVSLIEADRILIEGLVENVTLNNLTFLSNYAAVSGLDKRISTLRFFDRDGKEISPDSKGDVRLDAEFQSFSYEMKLFPPDRGLAHVSWLSESFGLLMLNDLIPQELNKKNIRVTIELPKSWQVITSERQISQKIFEVDKPEDAVFLVGQEIRKRSAKIGVEQIEMAFVDHWQFSDEEAFELVRETWLWYQKKFGSPAFSKVQVFLLPFPKTTPLNSWSGETRGSTVTLVASPTTFKSTAIVHFGNQIRHELLHLWIPNSLNLKGNYDWFFEGFVVYQALKTGVFLGQIRFEDFLSAIANAYDFAIKQRPMSLLEASLRRWYDSNQILYSRSLLVAFLVDLRLLQKNKVGVEKVFRDLLRMRKFDKAIDGNSAVIGVLSKHEAIREIINKYVKDAENITLTEELNLLGIEMSSSESTQFRIMKNLSDQQKELIEKLGYNQLRNKKLPQMKN